MGKQIIQKSVTVPDVGDIFMLSLDNTVGHEQSGMRPFVVITTARFNNLCGMAIICPVTSKIKNYVFHVNFSTEKTRGAIMIDQIRSIDWRNREMNFHDRIDKSTLDEVREKMVSVIGYKTE